MYYEIYSKGSLTTANSPDFSQPFPMDGNAFQLGVQIVNLATGATGILIDTLGSNDLNTWSPAFGTQYAINGVGPNFPAARTAVAFKWVRLKISCVGAGGVAVFWIDCNTASL
ncbi:MAG: hypothetical protein K8T20_12260 [Planctomycetes bacterium]|nr:hypothetical protein [Planctomycetota bacterium]